MVGDVQVAGDPLYSIARTMHVSGFEKRTRYRSSVKAVTLFIFLLKSLPSPLVNEAATPVARHTHIMPIYSLQVGKDRKLSTLFPSFGRTE